MVNHDGDELLFSKARYTVLDRKRLLAVLAEHYEEEAPNAFVRLERDVRIASLEVGPGGLEVECNSRQRLKREKETLERVARGLLQHRLDEHEDPMSPAARSAASSGDARLPAELPPELLQAMSDAVLTHMRKWVDEPVPALEAKTPRQAVHSERGRESVQVLLHQQAQLFRRNPQTAHIDLTPIYETLGLRAPIAPGP